MMRFFETAVPCPWRSLWCSMVENPQAAKISPKIREVVFGTHYLSSLGPRLGLTKENGWSSKRTQHYCFSDIRQAHTVHIFVFFNLWSVSFISPIWVSQYDWEVNSFTLSGGGRENSLEYCVWGSRQCNTCSESWHYTPTTLISSKTNKYFITSGGTKDKPFRPWMIQRLNTQNLSGEATWLEIQFGGWVHIVLKPRA